MTIDELIVKLSLDAAGLKTGAKDAQAAADKLATGLGESAERGEKAQAGSHKRTAASAMAMGKSITDSNAKVAQSFEGILRTGLAFLAMFTGAKTVEDFTRRMVALDAAVGRMAHNVGSTPERVSALAMAVARTGGTFEGATSAVQGLSDAYQELQTTGTNGIMEPLAKLQAAGGKPISLGEDWHKTLLQIGDDLKVLEDKGQFQLADSLGRKILGDPATANLAKGGSQAILAAEEQSRQHGVITKEQAEAAQKAQAAWADLNQSVTSFGNTLVTDLEPDITLILGKMDAWIDANKGWVASDIKADIESFGKTLSDHREDIERFGHELTVIVGIAGQIAAAFAAQSPAAQALELFAGLIGTKILAPLSLARAALGLGLMNPAVMGTAAVAGVLASGNPNKALLDGGRPDVTPRDNDLGLPGLDHDTDMPENKAPSDTAPVKSRLSEAWSWLKDKALATGFGDRLPKDARVKDDQVQSDPRVRDDIGDIAKSTAKTVDLLKAQQDAATVSNVAPVTVSSGGMGGSGSHASGTDSPGAALVDRARSHHTGGGGSGNGGPADPNLPVGNAPGASGYGTTNAYWKGPLDKRGEGGHTGPKEMFDYLKAQGASDNEAVLLTGSAASESSFNPNAVHDGGTGHGLFGHKDTRLDMRGKDWQQQSVLALEELRHTLGKRVAAARTPEELTDIEMHNERPRGYKPNNPRAGDNYMGRLNSIRRFSVMTGQPTASAPVPAGTSAKAVTDAEVFAARQRMVNGSVNPKDKAIVDRYLQEQNAPRPSPAPTASAAPPAKSAASRHAGLEFLDILRDARKLTHHPNQPMKVSLDQGSLRRFAAEHTAMLANAQRSALGHGGNVSNVDRRSSSETNIAELHVHSQARDAASIARDTHAALIAKREAADKGNYGLA